MSELDDGIRDWLTALMRKGTILQSDAAELEDHLRSEIEALETKGLSEAEAFLVGIHRIGSSTDLTSEFRKVNGNFLWKQLALDGDEQDRSAAKRILRVVLLGLLAGSLAKLPELFGASPFAAHPALQIAYLRNYALFFMPASAAYFLVTRRVDLTRGLALLGCMALTAFPVNLFPIIYPFQTSIMTALHLPVLLWLGVGLAYAGRGWRDHVVWLDFIRYSGEVFIYTVLILLGGGVLTATTVLIFQSIGVDIQGFYRSTILVYGAAAAPVVAVYLVDAKKGVIENIAPVLSRIFSPLFLLTLLAYLAVMLALGKSPFTDRSFLVVFDGLLLIVLGLSVYALSARTTREAVGLADWVTVALVLAALVADGIALSAILFRLAEYGVTANKLVVLGDNLLFLANLAWIALRYLLFLLGRRPFSSVVRTQTCFLAVYAAWAAVAAFAVPPIFSFH
jgi:hypothetical protein